MMDETVYANDDEKMVAANRLVWINVKYLEDRGYNPRRGDRSGSALADFGAIYQEKVLFCGSRISKRFWPGILKYHLTFGGSKP